MTGGTSLTGTAGAEAFFEREVASPAGGVAVEEVEEAGGAEEGLVGGEGAEPEREVIEAVVGGRPVAGVVEGGVGAEMVGRGAEDEEAKSDAQHGMGGDFDPWGGPEEHEAREADEDGDENAKDEVEHGARCGDFIDRGDRID